MEPGSKPVQSISAATIDAAARELVGHELPEADQKAVAELITNLFGELASLRALDVGETEPAGIYRADAVG
ncbi:MAG TPA: hypothetical protein VND64_19590 [Pirellulales bacterium]|nr:hypothetical protein [Pirellulales bacterium]